MRIVFSVLVGYLLGSISSAILLSRAKYLVDIRKKGSGNAGAANMTRVHGLGAGLTTLGCDMCKTALAGLGGWLLAGRLGLVAACGACLIGHCWPVFHHFRGGKGVSVSACIALLLDWRMFLVLVALFAVIFLLGRRVSLCSVLLALLYPLIYWLLERCTDAGFWLCCFVTVIVLFCHRGNIRRLLKGEEPRLTFGKSK
ncbi:MAG: glycerol-3-phosphate 1-O-acyltransferase PlsY [Oscillospiraceae bacterium]|nr:glycerol-3-phosphate 1-O-acyltransferase PlsY [Oscillospiraceae bacterium]